MRKTLTPRMLPIEKGVPIDADEYRISAQKYPFRIMEVGDSFTTESCAVRSAAIKYGRELDRKFKVAMVHHLERDGAWLYRVWRTA
jgi:hypothetical protein